MPTTCTLVGKVPARDGTLVDYVLTVSVTGSTQFSRGSGGPSAKLSGKWEDNVGNSGRCIDEGGNLDLYKGSVMSQQSASLLGFTFVELIKRAVFVGKQIHFQSLVTRKTSPLRVQQIAMDLSNESLFAQLERPSGSI